MNDSYIQTNRQNPWKLVYIVRNVIIARPQANRQISYRIYNIIIQVGETKEKNTYTAKRRDILEIHPPDAQEISQGWGFYTSRPENLYPQ